MSCCNEYLIVEFIEEEEEGKSTPMAIVSSKWITYGQNHQSFCYWPSYIRPTVKINTMVTGHADIDLAQCAKCPINIKYRTSVYKRAMEKMKDLEELSSVTQDESDVPKKRTTKKNTYYDDYEVDDLSEAESADGIPLAPRLREDHVMLQSVSTTMLSSGQKDRNEGMLASGIVDPSSIASKLPDETKSSSCTCNDGLLVKLMSMMETISEDIKYLLLLSQQNNNNNSLGELQEKFSHCESKEQLDELNESLSDPMKMNTLCTTLQTVGGKDVIDTTRRILSRIMSNQLAITYNWSGRNEKNNFGALQNIIKLVLISVRKNPLARNATQKEIEDITKIFLRNAPDREGGRNRRKK